MELEFSYGGFVMCNNTMAINSYNRGIKHYIIVTIHKSMGGRKIIFISGRASGISIFVQSLLFCNIYNTIILSLAAFSNNAIAKIAE